MADEEKLCSLICSNFEAFVVWCVIGLVIEKNWALSINQCWLKALQFLVHLIDLLSILLICNSFSGIQKSVVDQRSSRLPNSNCDLFFFFFFFAQVWLWVVRWNFFLVQPLSWLLPVVKSTFHCISQSMKQFTVVAYNKRRWHFKMMNFFDLQSVHEAPTYWGFSPFQSASNAKWP